MRDRVSPEVVISHILRWGVVTSAAIILFGVVLLLARQDVPGIGWNLDSLLAYQPDVSHPYFPRDIADILSQAAGLQPLAIIELGLLLLIAIPVTRIMASLVLFLMVREKPYALIAALVLTVLLISFFFVR